MSIEQSTPTDRLNYVGDLAPVITEICQTYAVGTMQDFSVIGMGYEDCNVIIDTDQDRFVAKMFAKTRTPEDVARYATIMDQVMQAGVNHPEVLHTTDGETVHTTNGISLVLMRFVEGKTFYELGRLPNDAERRAIIEQAAKINSIYFKPSYLFDSWAIPHIQSMYDKVRQFIDPPDVPLAEEALKRYQAIPVNDLPQAFVHGDIIKTNVVLGDDGKLYIIDFSVANWYPRLQELAVMAANLLHEEPGTSLAERCKLVADEYAQFSELTPEERKYLYSYALAGVAMEFMGSLQEKFLNGNDNEETDYWLRLGRDGLREALA
jgi:Ser/Thr protein kinase RdoA (MazF antagonist)